MLRSLIVSSFLALALPALADGPGTRLRLGPGVPQQPAPAAERDLERCERLRAEDRERCVKQVRAAAAADERTRGPESIGGRTSGAGSGATTGPSGRETPGGA